MRLALLLFPLVIVGCPETTNTRCGNDKPGDCDTGGEVADTDTDTDADTDTDTDSDTDADLPDARDTMVNNADGCQDVGGTPAAGAARYFWGEYRGDATSGWTGEEAAYVIANDTWKSLGGADCVAMWVVTATSTTTGSCPTCEVGMSVTAVYDLVNSTCPEDMYGDDFATTYAIDQADTNTATWYYATSAETLGTGFWADGVGANFLSPRACAWF
ncbi:MAG: hypothetical protein V4850_17345 [Myxococcota bacterium]